MSTKITINTYFRDNEKQALSFIITYLDLISKNLNITYKKVSLPLQEIGFNITTDYKELLSKYFFSENMIELETSAQYSRILIYTEEKHQIPVIFGHPIEDFSKMEMFFKKICQEVQLKESNCHDIYSAPKLAHEIYQPFYNLLDTNFPGLFWLNYFSAERMAALGGEKLFELPYTTKIERLNGGIFIQIGDSPEEALTPEGEERLYKATEWVYKLVRGEESPTPQVPEYFKVKPEHIQEIQLSAPVRKGQNTLIDLRIAVAWSEQKIILPKIKVTVTAVPQGSIGYYELTVTLPQEVSVEGVTYQLDSETRFRVEG